MRDYHIVVPSDGVVSDTVAENGHALQRIRQVLKGDNSASIDLDLEALQATTGKTV